MYNLCILLIHWKYTISNHTWLPSFANWGRASLAPRLHFGFIPPVYKENGRKCKLDLQAYNQPVFDSFSNLVKMPLTTCWHFSSLLCTVFKPPSLPPFDFFFGWVAVAKVVMRICSSRETCPPFLVPVNLPTNTAQTQVLFVGFFLPKTAQQKSSQNSVWNLKKLYEKKSRLQ